MFMDQASFLMEEFSLGHLDLGLEQVHIQSDQEHSPANSEDTTLLNQSSSNAQA